MKDRNMKTYKTQRGFKRTDFKDCYGESCSIQQASNIKPSIWLGVSNNRMILDRKLSWKLANRLLLFALFGRY